MLRREGKNRCQSKMSVAFVCALPVQTQRLMVVFFAKKLNSRLEGMSSGRPMCPPMATIFFPSAGTVWSYRGAAPVLSITVALTKAIIQFPP